MGGSCSKNKDAVIEPVPVSNRDNRNRYASSDDDSVRGSSSHRDRRKSRKKRRQRRNSNDSGTSRDSLDDVKPPPKSSSDRGDRKLRKSTSANPYASNDNQYAQDKGRLQQIADDMMAHPPQPLLHSRSYKNSVTVYDQKFSAAHTETHLESIFEGELEKLQNSALIQPYKSTKHRLPVAENEETTRHTQISEYRLKVGALVNCYVKRRQELQEIRYMEEDQRNKDLVFLKDLETRIKREQLPHRDVMGHMKDYIQQDGRDPTD